jgi:hypothetical protein
MDKDWLFLQQVLKHPSTPKVILRIIGILVLLTLLGYLIVYLNRWTPAKAENLVKANIPPGSTKQKVLDWLEKKHFFHFRLNEDNFVQKRYFPESKSTDELHEAYFGSWHAGIMIYEVHVYFLFDEHGILKKYVARESVTGF